MSLVPSELSNPQPRSDLPVEGLIYLDNSATSFPKPPEVYDFMDRFYRRLWRESGTLGVRPLHRVRDLVEETRRAAPGFFNGRTPAGSSSATTPHRRPEPGDLRAAQPGRPRGDDPPGAQLPAPCVRSGTCRIRGSRSTGWTSTIGASSDPGRGHLADQGEHAGGRHQSWLQRDRHGAAGGGDRRGLPRARDSRRPRCVPDGGDDRRGHGGAGRRRRLLHRPQVAHGSHGHRAGCVCGRI